MKFPKIIKIIEKELSDIEDLSDKNDNIEMNEYPDDLYASYTSSKYTQMYDKNGNVSDDGITHISFRINDLSGKIKKCMIVSLGVNPHYRNKGIGKKLVNSVEQIAEKINVNKILLDRPFISAVPFWNKMGYYLENDDNRGIFIKRL